MSEDRIKKLTVSEKSEHERELLVTIPKAFIAKLYDNLLKNIQRTASKPGFRPGKLPFSMVKSLYGEQVKPQLMEKLVDETLPQACKEKSLIPVSKPSFEPVGELNSEEDFTYKVIFQVKPQIDIQNYENLKVELTQFTFDNKDVDNELDRLRGLHATFAEAKERKAIEANDLIIGDLDIEVDGQVDPKYHQKDFELALFNPQIPEGFKKLVGTNIGSEVEVDYKPDLPELKDKDTKLKVTVKVIKERILPVLDDEFAKDVSSNFASLNELKDSITKNFEATLKRRNAHFKKSAITKALMDANPFSVPEGLVEQVTISLINQDTQNMPKEQAEKLLKDHWKEIWESTKTRALHVTQSELLYENLIDKLKVEASEEEINALVKANKKLGLEDARFNVKVSNLMKIMEEKSDITTTEKSMFSTDTKEA